MSVERAEVRADDGRALAATWFRPEGLPVGAVILAPAMATPSAYYRPFAQALADEGFLVLTFDYRGVEPGEDLRHVRADILTWARDAAAALEALKAEVDATTLGVPVTWVGHSLGGQILAFVDHTLVDRIVVVATGQGHWRHNPPTLRRWIRLFWNVVVPVTVRVAGYYPGRRLRFLDDLPAGVVLQWRRWCLDPGYWAADVPDISERHAQVQAPVTAIHLADDEIVTRAGIVSLLDQLVASPTDLVELSAADLGADRVGHHGFFRRKHLPTSTSVILPRLAVRPSASPGLVA